MEIWKDIKGYEGGYQVSDLGRVKSLSRKVSNGEGFFILKGRILKPSLSGDGYLVVGLSLYGKRKTANIHKLVAIAFLDHKPGEDGFDVDHKKNIKTDNRVSELQLITRRYNSSKDQWRRNPSSKYHGVHWCKKKQKWVAQIRMNKKIKHLGLFTTEIEAHHAYQKALKDL